MNEKHFQKKNVVELISLKSCSLVDYKIFLLLLLSNCFPIWFSSSIFIVHTFCRTEKMKYGLCVLFFNLVVFSWVSFLIYDHKCTVTSSHSVMIQCDISCPRSVKLKDKYWALSRVLPIHITPKKKATHSRHFIVSCPPRCLRRNSSDIHHRHHLSSFFAQRKYLTIAAQYRTAYEFFLRCNAYFTL